MSFEVVVTERAEADIEANYVWWRTNRSCEQAEAWYDAINPAIQTLSTQPNRCPLAAERGLLPSGLRQLLFGIGRRPTHRIVFTVVDDQVVVLRVRRVAQDVLSESDL